MSDTSAGLSKGAPGFFSKIRPFVTGLLPLFMAAHFGHHVVGAMLNPLMPMIRTDLGLNYTQSGFLMSVFSVVGGIAQLPAGWLADRFGARLMVLISVTGVAICGVLIGLSTSYTMLVVLLGLAALLGGGYHPASATAISIMTPPERRGRALGLHLIGGTSSFWVVLLVATPIAAATTFRIPFIFLSAPIIALGILLYVFMGRYARSSYEQTGSSSKKASETGFGGPVKIKWSVFLPFIILTVGTGMIVQSVGAYNAFLATDRLGVSEAHVILLMAITPFVGMFIAPLSGYFSDRFGPVSMVVGSALLAGPLLFLMSLVPSVAFFVPVLVFMGIANMARAPSSEAFFVTQIPARRRATILGIYFFAGMELAGVMTPLAGRLIDSAGFGPVLTGAAIAQVILAVVCWFFLRNAKAPARTDQSA